MKQEKNGMVGTEWQPVDSILHFYDDHKGIGHKARARLKWCREYNGFGRFYLDDIFGQIYFEDDRDREMFILRWS